MELLAKETFKEWAMPYMIDEINALIKEETEYSQTEYMTAYNNALASPVYMTDSQYNRYEREQERNKHTLRIAEYQKYVEYYKKTYDTIVEICDKTASQMQNEFGKRLPNILENYTRKKEESNSEDITTYTSGYHWTLRTRRFVYELLNTFSNIHDFIRFYKFKTKTKFSQIEAESVICYMKEKLDINIKNFDNKFAEIPFKKDTLVAMKSINEFSSENSIAKDDTLDLFCEYIGESFFKHI